MTDPYFQELVPPKTLSIGFLGVPPGSIIQSVYGPWGELQVRHGNFGTNPRWMDLGNDLHAFIVDKYINAVEMFWVIQPDGISYLMVANPLDAPRARCSPATMLLDRNSIVRNAVVRPALGD